MSSTQGRAELEKCEFQTLSLYLAIYQQIREKLSMKGGGEKAIAVVHRKKVLKVFSIWHLTLLPLAPLIHGLSASRFQRKLS